MQVNCIWRSGLLFAALFLAIAKPKPSSSVKGCYPRGTLFQAVDTLYVKAAWLKATIPVSIGLCLKWWLKGHLSFWMKLISLCLIVGRPHKKYTIIKKENKKAIYGKPEGFCLCHFSTCLMLSPPHFNFSRWPLSNNQAGISATFYKSYSCFTSGNFLCVIYRKTADSKNSFCPSSWKMFSANFRRKSAGKYILWKSFTALGSRWTAA